MSWAARRRLIILIIIGVAIVGVLAVVSYATLSETPSCTDNMQNQDEAGIDCGGSCAYLCTAQAQPPTILYTKALSYGGGRTDVIASVENKNTNAAAKDVPYRIILYGAGQALVQEVTGTIDLPPGTAVPVFVPQIASGKQVVTGAFLDIAASSVKWFSMTAGERSVPIVFSTIQSGTAEAPRIQAMLSNPTATPYANVQTIILVRDKKGDIIAASSTVLPSIPAQGEATASFTWNKAFSEAPAAIEVVPIILLP